jgi:serine/threonine-protein kinase
LEQVTQNPPKIDPGIDQAEIFELAEELFRGRFAIKQFIAASYSRVLFVARDLILNRPVALRVHTDPDSPGRRWFEQETELLAALDHPGIRTVYTAGPAGDWWFRTGKWIEGESLLDASQRGPRSLQEVIRLARDLISTLEYAHSRQIVLRRIVPATVMLDRAGKAVITDVRFANRVLAVADPNLARESEPYLAPETWHGHAGEPSSDVYAVGALLYFAVTGTDPASNPREIIPPMELRASCPQAVQRLIMRALKSDPRERYHNAAEMAEDLHSELGDFQIPTSAPMSRRVSDADNWEKQVRRALGDEYELLEQVGSGGFGSVYRVRDLRLEREVALKILHPDLTTEPEGIERFRKESQLAAQLSHPNIVSVYDTGGRAGFVWYTMAYVKGMNLSTLVVTEGPLSVLRMLIILDQSLDALRHAHQQGVVHRDLKPENILIDDEGGAVRITDFGLAIALHGQRFGGASSRSGTPEFASPEQLLGEPVDLRSDLYSLTLVAYFTLTGRSPFSGGTVESVLARQSAGLLPDIQRFRSDLPKGLANVLTRGAARDPADRFSSAAEYAGALRSGMDAWAKPSPGWWNRLFG